MKNIKISDCVIRRLPRYIRKIDELLEKGETRASSAALGALLGFTSSQVRQDFAYFGEFGQQGYGYNLRSLREQLADIMGMNRALTAILIGAGNIGRGLLCNFSFKEYGLTVEGIFDTAPELIGEKYDNLTVLDARDLPEFLAAHYIDLAVLCVPSQAARETADTLIKNGVNAIWNFTNKDIVEPDSNVLVENMHFSDSLLSLSYHVAERKQHSERSQSDESKITVKQSDKYSA